MKTRIDKEKCIGCGACTTVAPSLYEFDDDGLAKEVTEDVSEDLKDDAKEAMESCPTDAVIVEEN